MSGASDEIENFFKWVNTTKRIKPCYESLDMRGKVSASCSRYVINGRVHYLDNASFTIFQEGLKRNRGVFTVDVYKAVVLKDRTLFDQPKSAQAQTKNSAISIPSTAASAALPAPEHEKLEAKKNATTAVKFGYFRQKSEEPAGLINVVQLQAENVDMPGAIASVSESNLVLNVDEVDNLVAGHQVTVQFTGIRQNDSEASIPDVDYLIRVVRSLKKGFGLELDLVPEQRNASMTLAKIAAYFDPTTKTETADEYESLLSWYFERTYAESLTRLPFFMVSNEQGDPAVKSFAISNRNRYLASFFYNKSDRYNMSPLCLPERLVELKKRGSLLVVMYRDQGASDRNSRIHSAAENDYASREEFLSCVQHAFSYPEHCLVRLSCEHIPLATIPEKKVEVLVGRLHDLSSEDATSLVETIGQVDCVGFVSDMTVYAQRWVDQGADISNAHENNLKVWVGSELRNVKTGKIVRKTELSQDILNPDLIRFGYVERRREHRYLARTAITVTVKEKEFSGFSSDISWHGLCVNTDSLLDIRPGILLRIGFPTMQEKRQSLQLLEILYRVVNATHSEVSVLRLERITGAEEDPLDEFFDEVIQKNQHKLKIDAGDVISSISARVYESLAAINSESIAFFIGHHKARGASLLATGLPFKGNQLAAYCSKSNTPNPATLLTTESVRMLFDAIHLHGRQVTNEGEPEPPFGFDMAVFDKVGSGGLEVEVADEYSSEGFQNLKSLSGWNEDKKDCRILRLVATSSDKIQDDMFKAMLEDLKNSSQRHGEQLLLFTQMLVGCGEIIDVTDQYAYFWP